jgi:hypothetical protein
MRMLTPLVILVALVSTLPAGAASAPRERGPGGKMEIREVFDDVQRGILQGNVAIFSPHLHAQVRVTLHGGETGLYSANQAYYLLENFFRERAPVSFKFTTFGESDNTPYGTGSASFTFQGVRQHVQVYVALAPQGGRWVITHINIY